MLAPANRSDVALIVEIDDLATKLHGRTVAGVLDEYLQHFRSLRVGDHRSSRHAVATVTCALVVMVIPEADIRDVFGLQVNTEAVEWLRAVTECGPQCRRHAVELEVVVVHELEPVAQAHGGLAAGERLRKRQFRCFGLFALGRLRGWLRGPGATLGSGGGAGLLCNRESLRRCNERTERRGQNDSDNPFHGSSLLPATAASSCRSSNRPSVSSSSTKSIGSYVAARSRRQPRL